MQVVHMNECVFCYLRESLFYSDCNCIPQLCHICGLYDDKFSAGVNLVTVCED